MITVGARLLVGQAHHVPEEPLGRPTYVVVATIPVKGTQELSVQLSKDHLRSKSATVVANVNNQAILPHLRIERLHELPQSIACHVCEVYVPDAVSRHLRNVLLVLLHPSQIPEIRFISDRVYQHIPCADCTWLTIDEQAQTPHVLVTQCAIGVVTKLNGRSTNSEQIISLAYINAYFL